MNNGCAGLLVEMRLSHDLCGTAGKLRENYWDFLSVQVFNGFSIAGSNGGVQIIMGIPFQ
jgi:hypothetical protein